MLTAGKKISRRVVTIGDHVYQILRKEIIDMNLKPGQVLNMKDIAEQLQVSRSPVRDAILRLDEEGLVDSIPQKGTAVSRIDLERVRQEQFIRISLEERVVQDCLEMDMKPWLEEMNRAMEEQKRCIRRGLRHEFLDYDDMLHEVFFRAAGREFCWNVIRNMSGHYRRIRLMSLWDDTIMENVYLQHQAMVRHLLNRDGESLLWLLREHCRKLSWEKLDMLKKYPDYFAEDSGTA